MSAATWVIIPVKSLPTAKQRLSPLLPAAVRRQLVLAMLQAVLAAAAAARGVHKVLVVTPDADVAELAKAHAAEVLRERRGRGLNAAVRAGLAAAAAAGARRALVLPADVPLVSAEELGSLLQSAAVGAEARVTLVPAADGEGTNGLLLAPPQAMQPAFGPGSYVRHLSQALAKRIDVEVLHLPGLAADIDQPRDLNRLLGSQPELLGFQFLARHVMKATPDGNLALGADRR
jgi:2-phospho-L-lactate guanylyltransferase